MNKCSGLLLEIIISPILPPLQCIAWSNVVPQVLFRKIIRKDLWVFDTEIIGLSSYWDDNLMLVLKVAPVLAICGYCITEYY